MIFADVHGLQRSGLCSGRCRRRCRRNLEVFRLGCCPTSYTLRHRIKSFDLARRRTNWRCRGRGNRAERRSVNRAKTEPVSKLFLACAAKFHRYYLAIPLGMKC